MKHFYYRATTTVYYSLNLYKKKRKEKKNLLKMHLRSAQKSIRRAVAIKMRTALTVMELILTRRDPTIQYYSNCVITCTVY